MRIVGLDLSLTATGWATGWASGLDEHGDYLTGDLRGVERLANLHGWLTNLIRRTDPDLAVVEGYAYGKSKSMAGIAEWGGIARLALYQSDTPFVLLSPPTLKKFATGRGVGPKADMRMALYKRTGLDIPDDNEVDAIWLCAAGHQAVGDPLWEMPKVNVEALGKVDWPEVG